MKTLRRCGVVLGLSLVVPWTAFAQNTTIGSPAYLAIGQPPLNLEISAGALQRWYLTGWFVDGRSYCAVTGQAGDYHYGHILGMDLEVRQIDGTTVVASNDGAYQTEPGAAYGQRACFIATAAQGNRWGYVGISWPGTNPPPIAGYLTLRVLETTLWCPWFFIDGDYNAFTLLQNTTKDAVNIKVTWRNASGQQVGTFSGSIPGNGNLSLNARTYATGTINGSIAVAHNGSPQAIVGSTTTLSATTGVGFDAIFTQRQPW